MNHKDFLIDALTETSVLAQNYAGKVRGVTKPGDNNQVLTAADLAIGKMLIGRIQSHFPEHNIIDEEAGVIDNNSAFTWVIDPIDGTSNFASGSPLYGSIIGLLHEGVPVLGGATLPAFHDLFWAEQGNGASRNGEPIHVASEASLLSSLVSYGIDGHQENPSLSEAEGHFIGELVLNIRNLRSSGSLFDALLVAQGCYGAALVRTSKIWDNVGIHCIVSEAGGVYTDFIGNEINYSEPTTKAAQNFTARACAPNLSTPLTELTRKHFSS